MKQIPLTQGKETIVDDDVYEWAKDYKWHYGSRGYAIRCYSADHGLRGEMRLHHAIMGFPLEGFVIDHLNGNGLDNRRENLRLVTHRKNMQNRIMHRNGKLPGTRYDTRNGRWYATITVNNKHVHLGTFDTEVEAYKVYVQELENRGFSNG